MKVRLKHLAHHVTLCDSGLAHPYIALEHIESETGKLQPRLTLPSRQATEDGLVAANPGDVLFGKLRPYLAKVWLVDRQVFASTELLCLRPNIGVFSQWFYYLMVSKPVIEWAVATSDGAKMPRTSWERLGDCLVEFPSCSRQQTIAAYLTVATTRIDALIEKKHRMIGLLLERIRSLTSASIDPLMKHNNDGTISVANDIRCTRLGSVARIQTGLTLDANRDEHQLTVTLPYLRVANVQDGSLNLEELKSVNVSRALAARCTLNPRDVLMTEGGDPDKLGRGTIWPGTITPCLHQNHIFAIRPSPDLLLPEYLALVTRTPYARAYFEMTASKTTGIASTSTSKIASFRVPLPPISEQRKIVDAAEQQLSKIAAIQERLTIQIARLKEHRQALIATAVTGELDIQGITP
ncbi:MAG TPA: restriction endonuclease subunit S [Solirubrobacteraceae bacterium]|jgi:type I restriction enzyme S subunit